VHNITAQNTISEIRPYHIPGPIDHVCSLPDLLSTSNSSDLNLESALQLSKSFLEPIHEYLSRPRKNFRSKLVDAGFQLITDKYEAGSKNLSLIKDAVECLHAGSLIIDDIQDGSSNRRGQPSFHYQHGTPAAICAGNWMYFWPLRLLEKVEWLPSQKIQAYEYFSRALELGHYGQHLDITIKANETPLTRLADLSIKAAELKTGTITALAFVLGAVAAGASREQLSAISIFGGKFGLALQRLDDWGNLCSLKAGDKKFEDLIQNKPTTIWHDLIRNCTDKEISDFKRAVAKLPDQEPIAAWLNSSQLGSVSFQVIEKDLMTNIEDLKMELSLEYESVGIQTIKHITENLLLAYN